jgi:ubiquinone/menaquinone biosynthesis C-methylase UbiE
MITCVAWPQAADYANSGYKTSEGRARVAKTLVAHDREQTQKPRELVSELQIMPGMTVADIGTGAGFMLPYLSDAVGSTGVVLAEDIFPDFLEQAKATAKGKNIGNARFILGTVKTASLPQNSVDVALVLDAYHHFDYPAEMLGSLHQALKPGGKLAIVEFYPQTFRDPKQLGGHCRFHMCVIEA